MNGPTYMQHRIVNGWMALKFSYGLLFVVAGADKFTNMVTQWSQYISPQVMSMLPTDMTMFLQGVGIFEILLGFAILTKWTRFGAYIAGIWLLIIAVNLASMNLLDIAVRDVIMAIAAFVLGYLTN